MAAPVTHKPVSAWPVWPARVMSYQEKQASLGRRRWLADQKKDPPFSVRPTSAMIHSNWQSWKNRPLIRTAYLSCSLEAPGMGGAGGAGGGAGAGGGGGGTGTDGGMTRCEGGAGDACGRGVAGVDGARGAGEAVVSRNWFTNGLATGPMRCWTKQMLKINHILVWFDCWRNLSKNNSTQERISWHADVLSYCHTPTSTNFFIVIVLYRSTWVEISVKRVFSEMIPR